MSTSTGIVNSSPSSRFGIGLPFRGSPRSGGLASVYRRPLPKMTRSSSSSPPVIRQTNSTFSSIVAQVPDKKSQSPKSGIGSSSYGQGGGVSALMPSRNLINSSLAPITSSSTQQHSSNSPGSSSTNGWSNSDDEAAMQQQQAINFKVSERRLAALRQQPKNLSPIASFEYEPLLPPQSIDARGRTLLVLDIDETLVHASFTSVRAFNTKITIDVDGDFGDIYVNFRPHLMTFLQAVAPFFEVAVFTASQGCYASKLMDVIDPGKKLVQHRLFREHCTEVQGARVKDLSLLGRSLDKVVIVDNSPVAYMFQPRNAIPIISWFGDTMDTELLKLIPFLKQLSTAISVYDLLDRYNSRMM